MVLLSIHIKPASPFNAEHTHFDGFGSNSRIIGRNAVTNIINYRENSVQLNLGLSACFLFNVSAGK